eukprot:gnl/MRDRNA2_/MRDRNA2_200380_c0_seq1.p1 gnl/MRDRNA2_/MRDRNA2_200380_c0~~gnl/MRDRNA2_/MRDRNA2_200380_c0_seq1.p1  ORF type:complete len:119 (-),score=26.67 gnl/MRDRNA2_/MRDRNA2_200380_c0_seq1:82-438(-)
MTKEADDLLEELSAKATGGKEHLLEEWRPGSYFCARCNEGPLYVSEDKWRGPCPWPSFRKAASEPGSVKISLEKVVGYNGYECEVFEAYCGGCDLFLGHKFGDAKEKGDLAADAKWRH